MDSKNFSLNNGIEIPSVATGTWKLEENQLEDIFEIAYDAGYRHIDAATIYKNEDAVGQALKALQLPRKEMFLTTKLWNTNQTFEDTLKAFEQSLQNLQTDYIDLYLIHWPGSYERILEVWRAMEYLYHEGRIRAIGVSNFNVHHIDLLLKHTSIKPTVNQVECHPYYQNAFLNEYCQKHEILLSAYAPLMSWNVKELIQNETLIDLGKKYQKTPAQIALRWMIQREIIVIPRSKNPKRIVENIRIFDFELSEEDMYRIRCENRGLRYFTEPDNMDFGFLEDTNGGSNGPKN
ncbi:aldo/keto reductase [Aureivirga sp. CE67]|uniref:aldo/keto reductase n=1 Tax=Aureivirga sp. CE67 TaxID=1788983 RepID=UPI0018CA9559|nr:aldo/keto reductase [Aureivirga sp. CE67]